MRVYLAGPMRGYPQFNFPAFARAAKELRDKGHEVFDPSEADVAAHGPEVYASSTGDLKDIAHTSFDLRKALKKDTGWICDNAEAIALLPGWNRSRGAMAEYFLAIALDLEVIYL